MIKFLDIKLILQKKVSLMICLKEHKLRSLPLENIRLLARQQL